MYVCMYASDTILMSTASTLISLTHTHICTNFYEKPKPNGLYMLNSPFPSGRLSARPCFALVSKMMKKKKFSRNLVLIRAHSSSSSPVAGFEVDFKPSFDDYLKVMESVKTVREKRNKARTSGKLGDSGEKDEGSDGGSIQISIRDEPVKENQGKFVSGENVRWEKGTGNNGGSVRNRFRDETVYRKNVRWVKDKGNLAEDDDGNSQASIRNFGDEPCKANERKFEYGKDVRWVKDKGNVGEEDEANGGSVCNPIVDELPKQNRGRIVYGKNLRLDKHKYNVAEGSNGKTGGSICSPIRDEPRKANKREIVYGKNVRWEKDDDNVAVEDTVNGGSIRDFIHDGPKVNESKFGVKSTRRIDMYGTSVRWEKNQGNSTFIKGKDYDFNVDEDKIQGTETVVKNSTIFDTYGQSVRWEDKQGKRASTEEKDSGFRVNKDRIRGTRMVLRNEKFSADNVLVRNNGAVSEESDGDEEFGFERDAFKSIGGLDDVVDKPRISRNEMEERIQKLARCLNGADVNMPEWMFSKMMRSARIRFSDHSILRIIQILGKLENWKRVLQLIDWLQSRERFKSHKLRYIYTMALGVLGKARRPVEALNLFHTMQQHFSTYPDLVAYHSIAVTLGQAGHMRELFEVIDIMKSPPKKKLRSGVLEKWDPRLEPDIVIYNAVLNACVQRKQWEGAFWVLQQLKEKGQQPTGTTYGLVMEVMLACGKYNLVHDFYKKVLKSSIPNALTYKVLVNTLWREGKTDEAILAVEDMERRGVVGSAALYYDLARCLCSAGRCQEALVQVDKICRVANKPLVVTYTGLMQACLDAGNIEDGAHVFKHMHKFCSPNLVTCNIMLKAYVEHGKFEEATSLFHKLLEEGNRISSKADYKDRVIPDKYSFNTMLDACVEEQRWNEFEIVYKGMLKYGYPFNTKRHLRMLLDAGRAGKGGLLETTWNHLIQNSQISPPHPLIKGIFCMKLEQGDTAGALSYISSHHHTNLQGFSRNAWLNFFEENAHCLQKEGLLRLVNEVSLLMSKSNTHHLICQNLLLACREFLSTRMSVPQTDCLEVQTVFC